MIGVSGQGGPSLRVELLSAAGYRVPGFDAGCADAIAGIDSTAAPVSWHCAGAYVGWPCTNLHP